MTRVGWIGLGAMGAPMATCVARAGLEVVAYDIDPGRAEALTPDGVKAATTISQAAHDVDVLAVMVATPAQVEAVLYGDDPATADLPPGAVVLVMATVGPVAVHSWATRLASQGVGLVDAPVSGGVLRAAAGDLLIMVGGPEPAVRKVRPVLDAMASTAQVVGPTPGDGQKVKLVNQLLCGVHIAAAAEALALAEAMNLDAQTTWEVVRHGAAASFMLDDRGARMVARPSRPGEQRARHLRQGHGTGPRRRPPALLHIPARERSRAALPRRTPRRSRPAGRLRGHRGVARVSPNVKGWSNKRGTRCSTRRRRSPPPQKILLTS